MGKDFELRVVSIITRSRELSDEVLLLDLGSSDSTVDLAKKVNCEVLNYSGEIIAPKLASKLLTTDSEKTSLLINVNSRLKLRDIPLLVNRTKENWDINMSF